MRNIKAVFSKQIKETLKNKTILIQFLMFPVITIFMNCAVHIADMPENFFTELFAVMYAGMAPLVVTSTIVAEEKEKGTLKALMMSGIRPFEYLLGIGGYIWIACMVGSIVIALSGTYNTSSVLIFLLFMAVGIIISMLMGAAVGIRSHSQMSATSVSVPLMMVFAFLPMLAMFNDTIEKIAKYTYTRQLQLMLSSLTVSAAGVSNWLIIIGNGLIVLFLFAWAYKKDGLES